MRDQAVCDLITDVLEQADVVGGEVLGLALVSHLNASDGVVAELDGADEHVARYGVELLVEECILTKLVFVLRSRTITNMNRLACVEDSREDIWLVTVKLDGLAQSAGDDLTIELVFDAVV